jgi:hypothetical protein
MSLAKDTRCRRRIDVGPARPVETLDAAGYSLKSPRPTFLYKSKMIYKVILKVSTGR